MPDNVWGWWNFLLWSLLCQLHFRNEDMPLMRKRLGCNPGLSELQCFGCPVVGAFPLLPVFNSRETVCFLHWFQGNFSLCVSLFCITSQNVNRQSLAFCHFFVFVVVEVRVGGSSVVSSGI